MIIFERLGGWGLGNSMFQIATTYTMAKENNMDFGFPNDCLHKQKYYDYKNYYINDLPWVDMSKIKVENRWGYGSSGYLEIPKTDKTTNIDGFFQSQKYVNKYKDEIIGLFKLQPNLIYELNENLDIDDVALHVRRNDYVGNADMRLLDNDYYKKAVGLLGNKRYHVFSDDIEWCKENLNWIPIVKFVEERDEIKAMYRISQYQEIIMANSTFSWWSAYMSKALNVIIPNPSNNWFTDDYYNRHGVNENKDLVLDGWIQI